MMDVSYITREEIVKIREIMGLNQSQFARAVGAKTPSACNSWEKGKCMPTGARYEKILHLKKKYLANGHDEMPTIIDDPNNEAFKKNEIGLIYELVRGYESLSVNGKMIFKNIIEVGIK